MTFADAWVSYHGIASHYLHSSSLPDLERRLSELTIPDYASFDDRLKIINNTISEFSTGLPDNEPIQLAGDLRKLIDRCFSPSTVEEIFASLDKVAKDSATSETHKAWAQKTISTMQERSPTSLRVTNLQMQYGKSWDIAEAFDREHRIASRFMEHPDFTEGVSARLIRKPAEKPKWQPGSLADVSDSAAEEFFKIQTGDAPPLRLFTSRTSALHATYAHYPHAWLSLPSENRVLACARSGMSRGEVIAHFERETDHKIGVKEKIDEILRRTTQ